VTSFLALSLKAKFPVTLLDILSVTIPATAIGVFIAAAWSLNRGKDLDQDTEFQERMREPAFRNQLEAGVTLLNEKIPVKAKRSVLLFFAGVLAIVLVAVFNLAPLVDGKPVSMTMIVQIVMLTTGALILLYSRVTAVQIASSSIFHAGMVAVITITGVAWMSDTFIDAHKSELVNSMQTMVKQYSWLFAVALFCVSAFVKSQAATLVIMVPVGFVLGIPITHLIGVIPACSAYFFSVSIRATLQPSTWTVPARSVSASTS
jgi:anaerobic C4-dicarboxylate transporter DcuB